MLMVLHRIDLKSLLNEVTAICIMMIKTFLYETNMTISMIMHKNSHMIEHIRHLSGADRHVAWSRNAVVISC